AVHRWRGAHGVVRVADGGAAEEQRVGERWPAVVLEVAEERVCAGDVVVDAVLDAVAGGVAYEVVVAGDRASAERNAVVAAVPGAIAGDDGVDQRHSAAAAREDAAAVAGGAVVGDGHVRQRG